MAFVSHMEDVLEIYHMPYDPDYPVVCMDEPCKQMIGEVREPIPCAPGQPARIDDEYVRNGVAEIEPSVLKGQCLDRGFPTWQPCRLKWLHGKETEISAREKLSGNLRHRTRGSS